MSKNYHTQAIPGILSQQTTVRVKTLKINKNKNKIQNSTKLFILRFAQNKTHVNLKIVILLQGEQGLHFTPRGLLFVPRVGGIVRGASRVLCHPPKEQTQAQGVNAPAPRSK